MPRLLIVGNFLSSHGASRGVCEDLAPRLRESGWQVITTSSRRFRLARLADMLSTVWSRRRDYDVAQVDVYSGPSFVWAEAVCWLLRRIDRPYVLTLHGGGLPGFARANPRRVHSLLHSAVAVTAPSPYLLKQMAVYRRDIRLIPNGLDVRAHEPRESQVQPKLTWLRAYHHIYNPTLAVRTVARLKPEFAGIRLTMAGPDRQDSSKEATIAMVASLGMQHHIKIEDGIAKTSVPGFLATGDIFLNTTNVDNTPVTVLEAMASGMCVVSTDVGGIPDLLRSGEDSLLVPPDDEAAMASAVRRLLADCALAGRIRKAALDKVRQFDWKVVLPQWQHVLTSAAKAPNLRNAGSVVTAPRGAGD
jgi:L-malate glycosyltransferase